MNFCKTVDHYISRFNNVASHKRELSKINYHIHTDAVKYNLKNISNTSKNLNHSYSVFAECVLPEEITLSDDYLLERLRNWK